MADQALLPVRGCRQLTKTDMRWNNYLPRLHVNPETYEVSIDGERVSCEAAQRTAPGAAVLFVLGELPSHSILAILGTATAL